MECPAALQAMLMLPGTNWSGLGRRTEEMLGLKRHTVEIVAHDPGWALLAVDTCQAVWRACGELIVDVQHVGSTAVPDPPAKPVLDIAIAVATFDSMPELAERLTRIDYFYRGDHGDAGGYLFVAESSPDIRTTHVHVVEHSGEQWRNYLLFRDLLRNSPATRKRYAELKKELAPSAGMTGGPTLPPRRISSG